MMKHTPLLSLLLATTLGQASTSEHPKTPQHMQKHNPAPIVQHHSGYHSPYWFGDVRYAPHHHPHYPAPVRIERKYELPAPGGYTKAIATYVRLGDQRVIQVELELNTPSGLEFVVLRDDNAGDVKWFGSDRLDEVVSIEALDKQCAIKEYALHKKQHRVSKKDFKKLYEENLYPQIKGRAELDTVW